MQNNNKRDQNKQQVALRVWEEEPDSVTKRMQWTVKKWNVWFGSGSSRAYVALNMIDWQAMNMDIFHIESFWPLFQVLVSLGKWMKSRFGQFPGLTHSDSYEMKTNIRPFAQK